MVTFGRVPDCSGGHRGLPVTDAGVHLQDRLEILIEDFRTSADPPMPAFVLHAQDSADDGAVAELVQQLYEGQEAHSTRCAVAQNVYDGGTEVRRAAAMVRALSDPKKWGDPKAAYRRYTFPRLRLVHAIDDAVAELGDTWPATAPGSPEAGQDQRQRLLDQLARQRWRPKGRGRWSPGLQLSDMAHILPASIVAGLAALLARTDWYMAVGAGLALLVLLTVFSSVLPGRAPIFLWLRRESRWFLTTTFLRAADREDPTEVSLLRPVRSWRAIAARAYDVAEALKAGGDFHLQLCVLALREDLRDNHRRWSWDLRGFKRPRPPMLFLPHADEHNGGIELIRAVNDVRNRRSELDPLVVVAAVHAQDVPRIERGAVRTTPAHVLSQHRFSDQLRTLYREWARNLRARQSPSGERAVLPWVMKVPLPHDQLGPVEDRHRHLRASHRPPLARLVWSLHTLVLILAVVTAGTAMRAHTLHKQYCSAAVLTANRDTRRHAASDGSTECIGVATGDVRFADWLPKADPGDDPKPLVGRSETPWTVQQLEGLIARQNADVLADHADNYVTVVYAGPLSHDPDGSSLVKGAQELAGVYLAQAVINKGSSVRLRVLVANGGLDLGRQVEMANAIASYAAHDPTVVGVVGAGRDLKSSRETTRILMKAGLPIVSGTNSATYLPHEYANWFSLAAPDQWQVRQLGLIAAQLRTQGKQQHALVLARDTTETPDMYTQEQARYGQAMLKAHGFTVPPKPRLYKRDGGRPELRRHARQICQNATVPSVIYFAGRVEDLDPLMNQLSREPGCSGKPIAILTGDDLSKADFLHGRNRVAPEVTLYHAALAELEKASVQTDFYADVARHLPGVTGQHLAPDSPALASGQTALAHDATQALYDAASRDDKPQSRALTWVNLRTVRIPNMATGTIDFTTAPPYGDRTGHSIVLKKVRRNGDGIAEPDVLCSRVAGDTTALTETECDIKDPK
ncbi:ABC transporter substrate-binding protein [Streptomyces sp. NBC_01478]|uniref:ABC transporter substrate-binding protein n=1 Tax=Streptomyces sp. NBC_01478 TaxID=2903882 RepID=UPI002E340D91|nr:ABC transporter substrate-binding protein [Streptomyces sp. NBC_01478]